MIDSTTKKQVIAVQKGNLISIKIYSWGDLPILEDYLEDKLQIEIESFKSILLAKALVKWDSHDMRSPTG